MRAEHPAIIDGDLKFYLEDHPEIITYTRACARETLLVIANHSEKEVKMQMPEELLSNKWNRLLANYPDTKASLDSVRTLRPWEVEVYELAI